MVAGMTSSGTARPEGRPRLRAAQKEMTRRLLLATALELFESKGYAATTIDDIANAAGTTRVTFYAHFPARVDLIRGLFGELNEFLEKGDVSGPPSGGPPSGGPPSARPPSERGLVQAVRTGTRDAIAGWIRQSAGRWPKVQPYLHAADEAAMTDPEIRALVSDWWDEAYGHIVAALDQAGRFEPSTRRTRAELAFAQLHHLATSWLRRGWQVNADIELPVLIDSWHHLLGEP